MLLSSHNLVKCPLTALHFKGSQLQMFGFEWERFQLCYLSTGLVFRLFHLSVIRYTELGSFPNFHRSSSALLRLTAREVRVTRTGACPSGQQCGQWSLYTGQWSVVSGPGILMGSADRGEGNLTLHWRSVWSGGHSTLGSGQWSRDTNGISRQR